jgi:dipeptidase
MQSKKWISVWAGSLILASGLFQNAFTCTSVLVTKKASVDGSTMISYSCDGEFHPHLRIIPAADHQVGEMADIRGWRGVRGKIPQVPHTYKVVGLINEHQLALGETTFGGRTELVNPEGLFHYYPLMLITLQRARTAREAIGTISELVEKYGYASEGESISIADKEEVWLMEIVGTGPGGEGGIWVARRIPEGMICATANMSRIREFPRNDPENCLFSDNVVSFAIEKGYYDPGSGKPFSFSEAYNPPTEEQLRYAARRIWSIFRRVCPSRGYTADFSAGTPGAKPYPLFVKPEKPLSVRTVINLHRDHYEGTEYDMTQDLTAGPFGCPDRCRPMKWQVDSKTYAWERPIATPQAGFVYVSQSRAHIPDEIGGINWYGLDNPYTNFFVPFYTSIKELPESYTTGTLQHFSRESAWWIINFVANYARIRWRDMIQDIQAVQREIEDLEFATQPYLELAARKMLAKDPGLVADYLTRHCISHADYYVNKWKDLGDHLITKYNDGYIQKTPGRAMEVGYPAEWLQKEARRNGERMKLKGEKKIDREL